MTQQNDSTIQDETIIDTVDEVTENVVLDESDDIEEQSRYTDEEVESFKADIKLLDSGDLPLTNHERMRDLLEYLIAEDRYSGEYNPTVTVDLVDSMIADMRAVEELPENGIVSISYTVEELEKFSKRLLRRIQASQHRRTNLPYKDIEEQFIRLDDERLLLTIEEATLLSYITSAMAIADHSPVAKSMHEGEWTNVLEYNERRIGSALVVTHKDPVKRIRSKLNLMNESAVQLVHSGLVLKLASASSLDQALLNDNLVASKIENSLTSFGTGLDTTSIFINEILVEHAHRQLVESNIGDMSKETFEEHLSVLDLDLLYNAMAISMFPSGFKLYRQCLSNDCNNIDEILINPRRCVIYRKDRLSNSAKQHLTRGFSRTDVSTIREYRQELNPEVSKYFEIYENEYVKFRVPTFAEYKRISKTWMEYLGDKSLDLMRGAKDEESRRRYIQQSMQKAAVMMYSHWIEGLYTKDENGDYIPSLVRLSAGKGITTNSIAVADEQLDTFLSDISLNREIHDQLLEAVTKFISDSNLACLVMAKTKCTKCGGDHAPEGEVDEHELISFNTAELFFTLLHQRTGEL